MSQGGPNSVVGSGANPIETLTGNSGGAVSPDGAMNIDVLGNNSTGIDVVGTPASNLMTVIGLASSTTQVGTIEIATEAEVLAGTDTTRAVVPADLFTRVVTYTTTALTDSDSPYTALSSDYYFTCDVTAGALTIDLPNAPTTGRVYIVKDATGSAGTHNITVTTVGGVVLIDGAATFVMNTNYESANFLFNGTSWEIF